ncbi:MAG: formyltransferase family protein [Acetivibrio ethanolgignens]
MSLYDWLREKETLYLYSERLGIDLVKELKPSLIISYNYQYIIAEEIIDYMKGNIINLHISYLPWNRGADPNMWSFIDNTPKGVTIHQVDTGIDTGKILFQRECFFDPEAESFSTTYDKLHREMQALFKENWKAIKENTYSLKEQVRAGSYHRKKELEELKKKLPFAWSDKIADFLEKYHALERKSGE